jgi:hypothetical protein
MLASVGTVGGDEQDRKGGKPAGGELPVAVAIIILASVAIVSVPAAAVPAAAISLR